eukprot:9067911-Lingulodinium_polyedra.AAC.1
MSAHGGAGRPRAGSLARRSPRGVPGPAGGGEDQAVPDSSDGDAKPRRHRAGHVALVVDYGFEEHMRLDAPSF